MRSISISKCREYVIQAYKNGFEDGTVEEHEEPGYAEEQRRLINEQAQAEWQIEHDRMEQLESEMDYYGMIPNAG